MFEYNGKKIELQKLPTDTFQMKVNMASHMEIKWIFTKTWKIHLDIRAINYSLSSTIPENCCLQISLSETSAAIETQIKEENEQYIVHFIYQLTWIYRNYFVRKSCMQKVYTLKPAEIICFDNNLTKQQALL